jgi:glucosamine kinase
MIVIESGGTKSTWANLDKDSSQAKFIETVGLHPREIDARKKRELSEFLRSNKQLSTDSQVFFYGAGCENPKGKDTIKELFNSHGFNNVHVDTDLKGACLALLGNQPGFIGILGTGAVAAQFDGQKIIKQTSGLGYIIGDEGSGFDIGKRLLNGYFNDDLPEYINEDIQKFFLPETDIIHRVYQPDGRKVIASLTQIAKKHSNEKEVSSILDSAFRSYYDTALKRMPNISAISFVGSVAYHFENELKSALSNYHIVVKNVFQSAINPLFQHHLENTN